MNEHSEINQEVTETINRYTEQLEKQSIPVDEVWLFGSQAEEKNHEYSDIDLGIVVRNLDDNNRNSIWTQILRAAAQIKSSAPLDPIPFSREDLQDKYSTLATEVREHGIRVK